MQGGVTCFSVVYTGRILRFSLVNMGENIDKPQIAVNTLTPEDIFIAINIALEELNHAQSISNGLDHFHLLLDAFS